MMKWHKDCFARDFTYVHMIMHREVYRLTYYDWCLTWNEVYWIPMFHYFWNSKSRNQNSNILIFQQRNSKKIRPESLESKTELEFRFRWGSQKSEPKIGIPNQAPVVVAATDVKSITIATVASAANFVAAFSAAVFSWLLLSATCWAYDTLSVRWEYHSLSAGDTEMNIVILSAHHAESSRLVVIR